MTTNPDLDGVAPRSGRPESDSGRGEDTSPFVVSASVLSKRAKARTTNQNGDVLRLELLDQLLRSVEERRPVALVTVVVASGALADRVTNKALVWLDREPLGDLGLGNREAAILEDARSALREGHPQLLGYEVAGEKVEIFVEVQRQPPVLLIVGAGHIAIPLAQMAKLLDFEVAVLDDRPSFANRERFPQADRVIAAGFVETLRDFPIDENTYVVLITRGHQHDVPCLRQIIDKPAAYIGMIGSRRRVAAVFQLLEREEGLPREKLERVYAPIGLDLGARTPAEIALSIMAEVVKVRRGGSALSLSDNRPSPPAPLPTLGEGSI